ncbi:MAG: type II toxin-antitoxin system VapC family toxin [Ideonella sp.]|jgi:predicted nucleic acid-binding protein|nr:type II toxin-antitoxin system VapC family toxin [Ideonella sp.]
MIVVATNVLAYFFMCGEHTAAAEDLYEREPTWVAPSLWRSEFRNLLAGYMRREGLTLNKACALQDAAQSILDGEFESDSNSVLRLVSESTCSAYDCEFVSLAERLNVKLVTMDARVRRAFPRIAVPISAG